MLSGPIPAEIGNLANLERVSLNDNLLTGELPANFLSLSLDQFWWHANAGLCAPDTPAFRAWLGRIRNHLPGPDCHGVDRAALDTLYYATGGPNWTNQWNWLTDAPVDDWYGVDVDSAGRVNWLSLGSNNLSGEIPAELGRLQALRHLSLRKNNLTGPIPPELGTISRLFSLNLDGNDLRGPIPPILGQLANLTSLSLGDNDLSGTIPAELGNLARLSHLGLSNNDLEGPIPDSFAQLLQLSSLVLDPANCVPATDAFAAMLRRIQLYTRGTIRCHPDAAALVALFEAAYGPGWINNDEWLSLAPLAQWYGVSTNDSGRVDGLGLHQNNLAGAIPPQLGDLSNLEELDLQSNSLSAPIPSELGNLGSLRRLSLTGNDLTGPIPDRFLQLRQLANFHADIHNCVPATAEFTAWLGRIPDRDATLCTAADRFALERLYEATGGPNWADSANWLTDRPLDDWYGVTTDDEGRVTRLELENNNLTGRIPAELGGLSSLTDLNLWGNQLSGSIPPELGNLASLRKLLLARNELTGWIPSELGNLARLEELNLHLNRLTGPIPPSLGKLSRLQRALSLGNNRLTGPIPPSLGNLPSLLELGLEYNRLTGSIPPSLGNLGNLEYLGLQGNNLTGSIPPSLGNLGNLLHLYLESNDLDGPLPAELGNLTRLLHLWVIDNDLTGPIPDNFLGLNRLRSLGFTGNLDLCAPGSVGFVTWLTGIQTGMERAPGPYCNESDTKLLERLYETSGGTNWTNSSGWLQLPVLDDWYGVTADDLGRVVTLDLTRNGLTGELRADLGSLSEMTTLRLNGNALSGRLPLSLTRLALGELRYSDTGLCAPANASFRTWSSGIASHHGTGVACGRLSDRDVLRILYDATNGPSWTNSDKWWTDEPLGDWYGVHTDASGRVTSLGLPGNGLVGEIPPELGDLTKLYSISLQSNGLAGPIPAELGSLTGLWYLRLNGNNLAGPIAPELGNLTSLLELYLFDNNLTGSIPPELGSLASLWQLALFDNNLTGPIPPGLGNLTSLRELRLDDNDLTGSIPPELGSLDSLVYFHASRNDLEGPLPPQLGSLRSLRELGLSGNLGLSGQLPSALTRLGDLESLVTTGTGLCVPSDLAFRQWLEGVENRHVKLCDEPPRSAAYLVQAVQSPEFPVPLVAGREALLRVFVTAARDNGQPLPPVRASFYHNGSLAHVADIPGGTGRIPTEVEEGSLTASVNALVPEDVVRPGLEMMIEIDPNGTLDLPRLGMAKWIPETGRLPVEVREMPLFELTLIPFLWTADPDSTILESVASTVADPEEWLWGGRPVLPVGDLIVRDHEPVMTTSNIASDLLRETQAIRAMESGSGYFMGTIAKEGSRTAGIATTGDWSLFSLLPGPTAHELGHSFNLFHAPCGNPGQLDPAYPYAGAQIGAWGYNPLDDVLVPPTETDIMSYCGGWISDYHYARALRHRLEKEGAGTAAAPTTALLLWGGSDADGVPFLEPTCSRSTPHPCCPTPLVSTGSRAGPRTGTCSPLTSPCRKWPTGMVRSSFVFALPAPTSWAGDLASITLSGPGGSFTLDGDTDLPMTILRDPRTGRIRGFLRGERIAAQAAAEAAWPGAGSGLEALFSRGIPEVEDWR